jgi:hypothetical protein
MAPAATMLVVVVVVEEEEEGFTTDVNKLTATR